MGWTPRQVDELSFWELACAVAGFAQANGVEEKLEPPTPEEHDALLAKYAHVGVSTHPKTD